MRTAKLLNKPIITPSAAYHRLRTQRIGHKFKYRAGIVIQPRTMPLSISYSISAASRHPYAAEMLQTVVAQKIKHYRSVRSDTRADGRFAVKNAHGIAFKPVTAGMTQFALF